MTATLTAVPRRSRVGAIAAGFGTEVRHGVQNYAAGWKATAITLVLFQAFALFALFVGRGQLRVGILVLTAISFMPYQFAHEQINRVFWTYLGDIQAGVLEQTYLTPLPSWARILGRQVVAVGAGVPLAAATYLTTFVAISVHHGHLPVTPTVLVPLAAIAVGSAGYALVLSGLTLIAKRIEILPGILLSVWLVAGGAFVPLAAMPAPVATASRLLVPVAPATDVMRGLLLHRRPLSASVHAGWGAGWLAVQPLLLLALGVAVFAATERIARRRGTLGRY